MKCPDGNTSLEVARRGKIGIGGYKRKASLTQAVVFSRSGYSRYDSFPLLSENSQNNQWMEEKRGGKKATTVCKKQEHFRHNLKRCQSVLISKNAYYITKFFVEDLPLCR